jgi:hypothetical protein
MFYKRTPEGESPFDALEPSFAGESRYAPFVIAVPLRTNGLVGIHRVRRSYREFGSWRFPQGIVYRPRESVNESVAAKAVKTAAVCVRAALGPQVSINDPKVTPVPFVHKSKIKLDTYDTQYWPDAVGKIYLPTVTPVTIRGKLIPPDRLDVAWHSPEESLGLLDEARSVAESHWDRRLTSLMYHTLLVSMNTIQAMNDHKIRQ